MIPLTYPLPSKRWGAAARRGVFACLSVLLVCVAIGGCSLFPDVKDPYAGLTAEALYKQAKDALFEGNYTKAIKLYETLEARFPYGRFAQQAILEGAYANYRANETAAAIAACDRFIRTYPNHPYVDYAYYLKGLVHFREDQGLMGYVYELDLSEREPKGMRESFLAFKELVTRFPDSRYAQDSRERMRYLTNSLALYDVKVARYYYNRGAYVAAINRAQGSLVSFPRTPANEDALEVLIKSYDKLGLIQLRDDSQQILKLTFPQSAYLAGVPPKPWWRLW
ncbi:MAG: outer membrane protein assembly factor BamD [Betaproteobacteria bacterium]